jgi:hypothetical protein
LVGLKKNVGGLVSDGGGVREEEGSGNICGHILPLGHNFSKILIMFLIGPL